MLPIAVGAASGPRAIVGLGVVEDTFKGIVQISHRPIWPVQYLGSFVAVVTLYHSQLVVKRMGVQRANDGTFYHPCQATCHTTRAGRWRRRRRNVRPPSPSAAGPRGGLAHQR